MSDMIANPIKIKNIVFDDLRSANCSGKSSMKITKRNEPEATQFRAARTSFVTWPITLKGGDF